MVDAADGGDANEDDMVDADGNAGGTEGGEGLEEAEGLGRMRGEVAEGPAGGGDRRARSTGTDREAGLG